MNTQSNQSNNEIKIYDRVIFYKSNSEKALEVESKGYISKINKKTYWVSWWADNVRSGFDWNGKMPTYWKTIMIKKDLVIYQFEGPPNPHHPPFPVLIHEWARGNEN